ncbi:hypothetical protein [Streptomyces ureilyticus]|uniref:hypothetical protein n=1 Tax=Streptomyces ureilyticus TaxID=1775131 RepID=UPI0019D25BEE|nr:hypothetical protein [Streptomyces ureilyticus]
MVEANLLGAITATEVFLDQLKDNTATAKPEEITEVIAFALSRPRHLAINEILLRPADQQCPHHWPD